MDYRDATASAALGCAGKKLYAVAHGDHRLGSCEYDAGVECRLIGDLLVVNSDAPCRQITPVTPPAASRVNSARAGKTFRKNLFSADGKISILS
ncbi:MAG: hypothetical protein LC734_02130 [Acidobacteria bacterium]|nr:hypothetical protein [Acidobacteriota bacterium]